jgi:hypothetical protein
LPKTANKEGRLYISVTGDKRKLYLWAFGIGNFCRNQIGLVGALPLDQEHQLPFRICSANDLLSLKKKT